MLRTASHTVRAALAALVLVPAGMGIRVVPVRAVARDDRALVEAAVRALFVPRKPGEPATLSDSADFTGADTHVATGRDLREQWQLLFEEHTVDVQTVIASIEVRGTRAEVRGRHTGRITRAGRGGYIAKMDDPFFAIVVKEADGLWRIWQLAWTGPTTDAAGEPRPPGVPPLLLAEAPQESRVTAAERAQREAAKAAAQALARAQRDSVRRARQLLGCDRDANDDGFVLRDTLFASIGPLARDLPFDAERGSLVVRDVLSHWKPPQPFLSPVVAPYVDATHKEGWGFRVLLATAVVRISHSGRVLSSEMRTVTAWEAMDRSLLAAIAATDTAGLLPHSAEGDTTGRYQVSLGFSREEGISLPVLIVPNLVERPLEFVLPRSSNVQPEYPKRLRSVLIEGRVFSEFIVDTAGHVVPGSVRITSETNPEFSKSVLEYLPKAQFVPARLNGCKVARRVQQENSFGIRKDDVEAPRGRPPQ